MTASVRIPETRPGTDAEPWSVSIVRRRRLLPALLLAVMMALGACSSPAPSTQDTKTSQAAPSSSSAPAAEPSGTGSSDGVFGGFSSMSEACLSVSATMLTVAILPLAGAMGGNGEDVNKAREELAKVQGKVPDELKPHFEKVKAFTEAAGSDLSKYGDPEFEAAMKPIQEWLDKNCSR